uniref:Uncharacterized protein n=1 Tax=Arundo donax TaxID=35708 RepID=A0A0A9DGJ2_ARUDO
MINSCASALANRCR